ncbi:MAG: glutamate--tRNA ligase [Candidatus Buchananbacteria bacterium]|nr:glutamate--tRNA ligase [Candidatus Buchananbacteria bacterium]
MANKKNIRTRFAPSPTGYLHVGGLRTALYSYLYAKQHGGTFILRVEDTDRTRLVDDAMDNMLRSLSWAGICPDEGVVLTDDGAVTQKGELGPYIQSERNEIYHQHALQLVHEGAAYYCFCDSKQLETDRSEQQAKGEPTRYSGRCRDLTPELVAEQLQQNVAYTIRLRVPRGQQVKFADTIRGEITINSDEIDDQVLIKSDGFATYHLANVVDDHLMEITDVIRGEEWLPSTSKHVLMYQAFGWEIPIFTHLPLLLGADRSKLSKRQGDVAVEDYRLQGYLPQALLNFVALLGWNPGTEQELLSLDELVAQFSLERLNKSGAVFDIQKLQWMNAEYIKQLPIDEFCKLAEPYLKEKFATIPDDINFQLAMQLEQARIKLLKEVGDDLGFAFTDSISYEPSVIVWKKSTPEQTKEYLGQLVEQLQKIENDSWEVATIETQIIAWIESSNLGKGDVLWPMRYALTGAEKSPSPFECAAVLGKEITIERLRAAIGLL